MLEMLKNYRYTYACTAILFVLSFFGCFMIVIRWLYTGNAGFLFLIWNLFLSWIPLGLSVIITCIYTYSKSEIKNLILLLLGILWLLFYPNAPYMITDFIHFRGNLSLLGWYDLVIYSLFIWTSFLIGFISIFLIYRIVARKSNFITGWLFVLATLFLSSYGIYLGRFVRWNSWDILYNPIALINSAIENISLGSIAFSLIFGILLTLTYALLYSLTFLNRERID